MSGTFDIFVGLHKRYQIYHYFTQNNIRFPIYEHTEKGSIYVTRGYMPIFFGIQDTGEHETLRTNSMRGYTTFISLVFFPSTVRVPSSFDTTTLYLSSKYQQPQSSIFPLRH